MQQLAAAAGQLPLLADSPTKYTEQVVEPMARLLGGGAVGGSGRGTRDAALRAFPLSLMLDHQIHGPKGSNDGRPLERMRALHRARSAAGEPTPLDAWPLLERPLLAQDLTALAVGVVLMAETPQDTRKAAAALCLARLAQALLEPGLDRPAPTTKAKGPTSKDAALGQLGAELGVHNIHLVGLEERVHGRWRPFLRVMLSLLRAAGWLAGPPAASPDAMDVADIAETGDSAAADDDRPVPELLARLGLPPVLCDLEAAALVPIFRCWSEQYRAFLQSLPFSPAPTSTPLAVPPSTHPPLAPVPMRASGAGADASSSETNGVAMAVDGAEPSRDPALEYHFAPFLSVVDGSVTAPDIAGTRMPAEANEAGEALPLCDVSHLGVWDDTIVSLVHLPKHYTELYSILRDQYWLSMPQGLAPSPSFMDEPALCLVCGTIMNAGPRPRSSDTAAVGVGECTAHARYCGSGHCIMLLINKGSTIIFRESRAAFYSSVYVDQYGEEDVGLRRGRPLFLNASRLERLNQLYRQHAGARETARIRASADRVIRDSYY